MAIRIDSLDEPARSPATGLAPSAHVAVINERGELLLVRRPDLAGWALPGGPLAPGSSFTDAAARHTREETGVEVEITHLVGTYTDPRHVMLYSSNGEVQQECALVYAARPVGGAPASGGPSSEVRWIAPADIDEYRMHESMRLRVEHAFDERSKPHLG